MITHRCPRCRRLIPVGQAYCDACRPKAEEARAQSVKASMRRYNSARDPKLVKFYKGRDWKVTSAAKLTRDPYCEVKLDECQGLATEVHHKEPLRTPRGWDRRLDWSNLMTVCTRCHNNLDEKWGKATRKRSSESGVIDLAKFKM